MSETAGLEGGRGAGEAPLGRILLVEDEANMVRTLARILTRKGYAVEGVGNGREALRMLERQPFDLVLTDLNMPVMDGTRLLREMQSAGHGAATIVLTGNGTIPSAVEAMKLGASDYLIKPCHPEELLLTVARVLELRSLRQEVGQLRRQLGGAGRLGPLVGASPAMQRVFEVMAAVSRNRSNVLLLGENGTGKELVARTIHAEGSAAKGPFLGVNCGALSETLLESQLFGHRRGSFTGATEDHEGVFQAATGGTLFLDEVTEIPLPLQVKFLRAIQEREVTPIGSTQPVRVDVRLIAAANRDIEALVEAGTFRRDLYYRLNVVPVVLPPLRERRDDIPLLATHFVEEFAQRYGVSPREIAPEAMAALQGYDWPGNIRELQNAIERAFALSTATRLTLADLPEAMRRSRTGGAVVATEGVSTLAAVEQRAIEAALAETGGNKKEAARLLGIERARLYRKIERYGLGVPRRRGGSGSREDQ